MDPFMKMALDAVNFGIINDAGFFDTMRSLGYKFKGDEKKEEFERISKACHEEWLKAKMEEENKKRERMEKKMKKSESTKGGEVIMNENELLQMIFSSYEDIIKEKGETYKDFFYKIFPGADADAFDNFKKNLEKILTERKKNLADAEKEEKVFMHGNSATYINPNIGELFGVILDTSKPTANGNIHDPKVLEKAIADFNKKRFISEKEKEYKEAIKKAQEAAKEYNAMKDKEDHIVYIPLVCELSMSISGMIDDDFESSTNILGVFTDPEMAERQCETDINCNDDDWKELKGPSPYDENYSLLHKAYKSKYFFSREFMVLEVKNRVILKMRLNDFNSSSILTSDHLMDQYSFDALLNIFENFKADYDKLLIDTESNIDNLLEERYKSRENEGEEECQP